MSHSHLHGTNLTIHSHACGSQFFHFGFIINTSIHSHSRGTDRIGMVTILNDSGSFQLALDRLGLNTLEIVNSRLIPTRVG